ncbi:hypothetical protein BDAP_001022 [Binucleata daphniae]
MQIFLNTINNETEIVKAKQNSTIEAFQQDINLQKNAFILFAGRVLNPKLTFSDYGICDNSTLTLSVRCLGGAMTETDKAALFQRLNKTICRVCYATNSTRATNCRKKNKCGGSSKLRPKKNKKSSKKSN